LRVSAARKARAGRELANIALAAPAGAASIKEDVMNLIVDAPPALKAFLSARSNGASMDELKKLQTASMDELKVLQAAEAASANNRRSARSGAEAKLRLVTPPSREK
jgi:hypothetical protein